MTTTKDHIQILNAKLSDTWQIWLNLDKQSPQAAVCLSDAQLLEQKIIELESQQFEVDYAEQFGGHSDIDFLDFNAGELAQSSDLSPVASLPAAIYSQTLLDGVYDVVMPVVARVKAKFSKRVDSSPPVQITIFDLIDKLRFSFQNRLEYLKLLFQNFHNPVGRGMTVPNSDAEWKFVDRRVLEIQGDIDFIEDWLFEFSGVGL